MQNKYTIEETKSYLLRKGKSLIAQLPTRDEAEGLARDLSKVDKEVEAKKEPKETNTEEEPKPKTMTLRDIINSLQDCTFDMDSRDYEYKDGVLYALLENQKPIVFLKYIISKLDEECDYIEDIEEEDKPNLYEAKVKRDGKYSPTQGLSVSVKLNREE